MVHRLLLVNPAFQHRVERIAQTSVGPPLGLAYLAASARQAGHAVAILDANAESLALDEIVRRAASFAPTVIGITATTPTIGMAAEVAAGAKRAMPGVPVVVGGTHATALPAATLAAMPSFDVVARGEAERTLPDLLARLDGRFDPSALADLAGVAFRLPDGTVMDTGIAAPIEDLDGLPLPARDLLPMHRYRCPDSDSFSTLLAMRGCPYPCVYCAVPGMFGRRVRFRAPDAVAAEIAAVHERWGTRFFSFLDDTFSTRPEWVDAFAEAMLRRGLQRRVRWICLTRADLVDRPLLMRMRAAGCVRVELGVESGSLAGRAFLRKGLTDDQVIGAFRAAREAGLSTMGFAILNIPGETATDVERTFDLLRRADPDFLQVSFLTPYPGTPLRDQAEREGWIAEHDWSRYSFLNDVVLQHGSLAPGEARALYQSFIRRFYLRPHTAFKLGRLVLNGTAQPWPLLRTAARAFAGALVDRRGRGG